MARIRCSVSFLRIPLRRDANRDVCFPIPTSNNSLTEALFVGSLTKHLFTKSTKVHEHSEGDSVGGFSFSTSLMILITL